MENKIIELLEKYEDEIMKYTLGNSNSKWGGRFADIYCMEWDCHKAEIANIITNLIEYGINVNPNEFAYVIISEWSGVITFDKGDLNIDGLTNICKTMLNELKWSFKWGNIVDYEVGTCENCGGRLIYVYCLDEVKCEDYCMEE